MPKQKTHKGLAKRVKVTANRKIKHRRAGARRKIKHRRAGASHLMSVKNAKRRRRIRRSVVVGSNTITRKMVNALNAG